MIVAVFALASPFAASAQATTTPHTQRMKRPIFLTGGKLSARPLRETATGGLLVPMLVADADGVAVHRGVIVEAGVGVDGYELTAGWGRRVKNPGHAAVMGQDIRATAYRKHHSQEGDATYAGAEAGLTFATLRVSLGAARRVKGPETADSTIFTFGVGFHIGF
jgi:hypothetical protein